MSNDYLAARFLLDDPRAKALLDIGWDEPDEDDVCQNYWRADQLPDDAGLVAEALVGALRDVYGVSDPSQVLGGLPADPPGPPPRPADLFAVAVQRTAVYASVNVVNRQRRGHRLLTRGRRLDARQSQPAVKVTAPHR